MPSLLEALERKYFSADDCCQFGSSSASGSDSENTAIENNEEQIISIFIPRTSALMCVPELLVLNDCDIDCAGDFESIKEKCKRVRELDLAQNKLDWQEVFDIVKHMPRIEFLNLSKNQLTGPIQNITAPSIGNLRTVVLNGTCLDWESIDVLLGQLSKLEELHLSLNNYKEVLIDTIEATANESDECANTNANDNGNYCNADCDCFEVTTDDLQQQQQQQQKKCRKVPAHEALKTLHFTGNPIENWHEICRLGRIFPNLENLVLAECPIKSIVIKNDGAKTPTEPNQAANNDETKTNVTETVTETANATTDDNEFPYKYFANLLLLNLSYANLNNWADIDQLARFPKLQNLRVKHWPLWDRLENTEHERRQLLIARLPNVKLLNGGGIISADEREDAERAFIRYYMDKEVWERPTRYDELIAKHGKLDPLVNISLKPDKHVKIYVTFKDSTQLRLVDVNRTVFDFKMRLERIIGIPPSKMRLYYNDKDYKDRGMGPEPMKFPNKKLYTYNIQPGDEIIIDQKE